MSGSSDSREGRVAVLVMTVLAGLTLLLLTAPGSALGGWPWMEERLRAWQILAAMLFAIGCSVAAAEYVVAVRRRAPLDRRARERIRRVLADALWCLAVPALGYLHYHLAGIGSDFSRYWDWGLALGAVDPGLIHSTTLSPTGFPSSQWAPGTGVFYAWPAVVAGADQLTSVRVMGVPTALLIVVIVTAAARTRLAGERSLVVLSLGVLLGGTNLGFYATKVSSELIATVLVVGTALVLRIGRVTSRRAFALAGAGAAVMLLCRPQALPMLLPAAAIALGRGLEDRTPARRLALDAILGAGLMSLALPVVFLVNTWMTGSPFASPYAFGDAEFSTWRPTFPYLRHLVVSGDYGLISQHLPNLAGVLVAAVLVARRWTNRVELPYHLSLVITFAVQVWITAGYYAWNGASAYGSRFLIPMSVLLTLAAVEGLGVNAARRRPAAYVLLTVVTAGGFWFAAAQAPIEHLAALGGIAALVQAVTYRLREDRDARLPRPLAEGALWAGNTLLLSYLHILAGTRTHLFVLAAGLIILGACTTARAAPVRIGDIGLRRAITGATVVLLLFVGYVWISFIRFTPAAMAYQAAQRVKPADVYRYRAPFVLENLIDDTGVAESVYEMSAAEARELRSFTERAERRARIDR